MCYIEIDQLNQLLKLAATSDTDLEKLIQPYLLGSAVNLNSTLSNVVCETSPGTTTITHTTTPTVPANIVVVTTDKNSTLPTSTLTSARLGTDVSVDGGGGVEKNDEKKEKCINVLVTS